MEITQIKERLGQIAERILEIKQEQSESGYRLAIAQGIDELAGISIDPLTDWARRMRELNTEVVDLVLERQSLKETKRALRTCECACH